mmetsp:Transcript_35363/g.101564  ORF Transcript_35363/g.101564 Transcript_35363/m.101564 type:complete len:241 (+) Transcript_35363:305-1027(+)
MRFTVSRVGGATAPAASTPGPMRRSAGSSPGPPLGPAAVPLERRSGGSAQQPPKATWKLRLDGGPALDGQDAACTGRSAAFSRSCIQRRQELHSVTHCCRLSRSSRLALITGVGFSCCQMMKRRESKAKLTSCGCSADLRSSRSCGDHRREGATPRPPGCWAPAPRAEALSPARLLSLSKSMLPRLVLALSTDSGPVDALPCWVCCSTMQRMPPPLALPSTGPPPQSPTSQMPMRWPTWP